jgi:DNA-binding XRE family transcriptional regulator
MEQLQSAFAEILVQQGLNFDASVAVFQLRYKLGLTQAQLAQRVGCLPRVITGLENGTLNVTLPLLK